MIFGAELTPLTTNAGCFNADGETHDARCVSYIDHDIEHMDKKICFNVKEDTFTIVDVTDKMNQDKFLKLATLGLDLYIKAG